MSTQPPQPPQTIINNLDKTLGALVEVKYELAKLYGLHHQTTQALLQLVKLENKEIDKILHACKIIVFQDGNQLFPRQQYPQVILGSPSGGSGEPS